jgi:hypothetical protein
MICHARKLKLEKQIHVHPTLCDNTSDIENVQILAELLEISQFLTEYKRTESSRPNS